MNLRHLLLLLCSLTFSASAKPWAASSLWDDGRAEFSVYQAKWRRYGNSYDGRVLTVLVKEPWSPDLNVKADHPGKDSFDVIKVNVLRDVPTGIYTYHQSVSTYLRRSDLSVIKLSATSSEACGISTADLQKGQLRTRSYFDGEGDRSSPWPSDAISEDALVAWLRNWVESPPPASVKVFPSLLTNRYPDLAAETYALRRSKGESMEVPAGTFETVRLTLESGKKRRSYHLERAAPHRMIRYEQEDGTTYSLAKSERIQYWKMHAPGEEAWFPKNLR